MKKIILSLFLFFIFGAQFLYAETPSELFARANDAYYKNQLKTSEDLYHQLINQGIVSGHLFYNLGNVYYRQGEVGEAVQYYEKALRYLPRNTDVRANLKFVEKKRVDNVGESFWISFLKIFFFWYSFVTIKELIIALTISSGILWLSAWAFRLVRKGFLKWGAAIFLIISFVLGLSTWFKVTIERSQTWAVVVKPEIEVKPTYLESEKGLFKLHEGTKVRVVGSQKFGEKDAWVQIGLPQGQKGWVRAEEIGVI